jgi:hypothetical protein
MLNQNINKKEKKNTLQYLKNNQFSFHKQIFTEDRETTFIEILFF